MDKRGIFPRRTARAMWLLLLACCAWNAPGRDVFVMLSGGDSPMDNNYSQYLQARAMTSYFYRSYPSNSVWVFFGAGNVEGEKPVLGDVLREVKRGGQLLDSWLAGSLPHNRPATREVVLRTLRDEILPAVASGGTLYLFVGDHGSRSSGRNSESIITLWGLHPDAKNDHGWSQSEDESLGVSELREVLTGGIGKGRLVFCMTQCHAGGFHYLAMPHEMTPNPGWFTIVPGWVKSGGAAAFPKVAGFTATDEYSLASGCNPTPDPADWAGYERYVPEHLLGLNLFTLEPARAGLKSFAEAHAEATLEDQTIDKPYSTSDQFLERWANLIEMRLSKEPNLTGRTRRAMETFQRAMNGELVRTSDRALQERQVLFQRFVARLGEQNAEARNLLLTGTRRALEQSIEPAPQQAGNQGPPGPGRGGRQGRRGGRGGRGGQSRRLWSETIRPAWEEAVESNEMTNLPAGAREFEQHLLEQEQELGRNYFSPGGGRFMDLEVYWESGYSNPRTLDRARAEAITLWGAERRGKILEWAKASDDEEVRTAAEQLSRNGGQRRGGTPGMEGMAGMMPPMKEAIDKETAVERTLFYRRVLAAWGFLIEVNERPALARVRELTELEHTPLPQPK